MIFGIITRTYEYWYHHYQYLLLLTTPYNIVAAYSYDVVFSLVLRRSQVVRTYSYFAQIRLSGTSGKDLKMTAGASLNPASSLESTSSTKYLLKVP